MMITKLVNFIVSKYFSHLFSVLIVFNSTSMNSLQEIYLNAVQESFLNLSDHGQMIGLDWIDVGKFENKFLFEKSILEHVNLRIEGFITILPSLDDFLSARLYAAEHCTLRYKDKYYLFLSENENPEVVLANDILKLFPHHLMVLPQSNSSHFSLWTQKYVGLDNNFQAIMLDKFFENGTFEKNIELFPNKLLNMFGRPLKVATTTYEPYVSSHFVPEGTGNVDPIDPNQPRKSVSFIGMEAKIVLTFCELRNCTIQVMPYGDDNWGAVYYNGSSEGMIGSVYQKETEFGICCCYNWYNELLETSIAIAKSNVVILVPAPSLYPAYMTIILPFNKLIWSLIILSILVSAIVMHSIMYFSFWMEHKTGVIKPAFDHVTEFELTQFQMIAIFFQQSFSQSKLDRFATRFFLGTLLLAGITLENTYSGQLKSLLTVPAYTEPVDTIKKFAATEWKWASPSIAWIASINFSDITHEKIMKEKFVEMTYEQLKNASFTGDTGIGLERLHSGLFGFGEYVRDGALDRLIITKDDLYYDFSRGISIRGWPLMPEFNTVALWCLDHGLFNYWESKYVSKFLDSRTQGILHNLASGHLQKYPPIPLTLANVSGPFFAIAIGYGLAAIVFTFDIFNKHLKIKNK